MHWTDANSQEMDPESSRYGNLGGTMRLGKRQTVFKKDCESKIRHLYGNVDFVEERHRHRHRSVFVFITLFISKNFYT